MEPACFPCSFDIQMCDFCVSGEGKKELENLEDDFKGQALESTCFFISLALTQSHILQAIRAIWWLENSVSVF